MVPFPTIATRVGNRYILRSTLLQVVLHTYQYSLPSMFYHTDPEIPSVLSSPKGPNRSPALLPERQHEPPRAWVGGFLFVWETELRPLGLDPWKIWSWRTWRGEVTNERSTAECCVAERTGWMGMHCWAAGHGATNFAHGHRDIAAMP